MDADADLVPSRACRKRGTPKHWLAPAPLRQTHRNYQQKAGSLAARDTCSSSSWPHSMYGLTVRLLEYWKGGGLRALPNSQRGGWGYLRWSVREGAQLSCCGERSWDESGMPAGRGSIRRAEQLRSITRSCPQRSLNQLGGCRKATTPFLWPRPRKQSFPR